MISRGSWIGFLIVLDFFMAATATYVDRYEFLAVTWYLVVFVPICPLYPLLLGSNFLLRARSGHFWQPLLHFTAVGIISYGCMALIFYPLYMAGHGFQWYEVGNIFWVLLYSAQIIFIFPHLKKIPPVYYLLIALYFFTKDFLDRFGETFSYQRTGELSEPMANAFLGIIVILHIFALMLVYKKSRTAKN